MEGVGLGSEGRMGFCRRRHGQMGGGFANGVEGLCVDRGELMEEGGRSKQS